MALYSQTEITANERLSIKNGSYAIIGISIVSNFAALFALRALHATSQEVAMITSLPALMAIVATWVGALWLTKVESKKHFCVRATIVARIFYFMIATIPFFIHGPALALAVVLLIALMNFPQSFSNLSWQSLIGDLIPEDRRSGFFGIRNRVTTFIGMLATLLPGLILQLFPVSSIPPYQVFFYLSFAFSAFEVYYLIRHKEHAERRPDRSGSTVLHPRMFVLFLRRVPYRRFLVGAVIFNLGWQMAWPLFSIYQIQYAGATAGWVSAFTVANQISQIVTFSLWGRLSERFGTTVVLAVSCVGLAVAPVLTILSPNMIYLTVVNLSTGMFVAGVNMLQFNRLLEVAPQENRTAYLAHFNMILGLVGFVAPELGVWLLQVVHMDPAMVMSSSLRFLGGVFLFITARVGSGSFFSKISFKA